MKAGSRFRDATPLRNEMSGQFAGHARDETSGKRRDAVGKLGQGAMDIQNTPNARFNNNNSVEELDHFRRAGGTPSSSRRGGPSPRSNAQGPDRHRQSSISKMPNARYTDDSTETRTLEDNEE